MRKGRTTLRMALVLSLLLAGLGSAAHAYHEDDVQAQLGPSPYHEGDVQAPFGAPAGGPVHPGP